MDIKELEAKWKKVEAILNESNKELYGKPGWKATSQPLHKGATPEAGKPGVENAPDEFDASKTPDTAPANKNKEGAESAAEEFEGSTKSVGKDEGNKNKEGAAGGAEIAKSGYGATSFRNKMRAAMGLSLDDKLNKPNAGKQGLSEQKKNLNEVSSDFTGLGDYATRGLGGSGVEYVPSGLNKQTSFGRPSKVPSEEDNYIKIIDAANEIHAAKHNIHKHKSRDIFNYCLDRVLFNKMFTDLGLLQTTDPKEFANKCDEIMSNPEVQKRQDYKDLMSYLNRNKNKIGEVSHSSNDKAAQERIRTTAKTS